MSRQKLGLEVAFRKVFRIRKAIYPNPAFWQQLRDLEAALIEQGALTFLLETSDGDEVRGEEVRREGGEETALSDAVIHGGAEG